VKIDATILSYGYHARQNFTTVS